ncbi:MAG: hypothetical protein N2512_13585 [Armatimonadetes bacterium]|nr:hypothetical protein [Armatimonadota bacterium]
MLWAGAERLRQLFNYANATLLARRLPLAEADVRSLLLRARERLQRSSVCLGELRVHWDSARAVVPAEPLWAEVLFTGWLEAACYGAPDAPIELSAHEHMGQLLLLTAECTVPVYRNPRVVRRRLAVQAASHLAKLCGGSLTVHTSKPKAVLALLKDLRVTVAKAASAPARSERK